MATGGARDGRVFNTSVYILRWLMWLLLALTLLQVLAVANPGGHGSIEQLKDRIRSGSTSVVLTDQTSATGVEVLWRTGFLSWSEAWYQPETAYSSPDGAVGSTSASARDRLVEELTAQAAQVGRSLEVSDVGEHKVLLFDAREPGAVPPLGSMAIALWIVLFGHMLLTREHRYANRWAWFWLFTVGQIGALLYLWKEPEPLLKPLLRKPGRVRERQPITGGVGCLFSIAWMLVVGIVVVLLLRLV